MSVVAIRCENCGGLGILPDYSHDIFVVWTDCALCDGYGFEKPPQVTDTAEGEDRTDE